MLYSLFQEFYSLYCVKWDEGIRELSYLWDNSPENSDSKIYYNILYVYYNN